MRVNKIICDVCKNEIDVDKDEDISIFERIKTQTKMNFNVHIPGNLQQMTPEKKLTKKTFDLCKKCSTETEEFLMKKIEEYKNK